MFLLFFLHFSSFFLFSFLCLFLFWVARNPFFLASIASSFLVTFISFQKIMLLSSLGGDNTSLGNLFPSFLLSFFEKKKPKFFLFFSFFSRKKFLLFLFLVCLSKYVLLLAPESEFN